jgi:hypothetical protein
MSAPSPLSTTGDEAFTSFMPPKPGQKVSHKKKKRRPNPLADSSYSE